MNGFKSTFLEGHTANFETLKRAVHNGDLALLECADAETGELVPVLVAIYNDNGEYVMTPLAKMFNGNPYDQVVPPGEF